MASIISQELIEAADHADLTLMREIVAGRVYFCPDFSRPDFDDALEYVKSRGFDIFQTLEGDLIDHGQKHFTDEDFVNAVYELKRNFCQERIEEVKRIGKALHTSPSIQEHEEEHSKNLPSLRQPTMLEAVGIKIKKLFSRIRRAFHRFFSGQ